jgi:replicative DNA helicase
MPEQMPNALSLEQALLGAAMIYPSVVQNCLDADLKAEQFYTAGHQKIFQAMLDLASNGQVVDVNTVVTRLQDKEELESSGGADYILKLMDSSVSSALAPGYIQDIQNKAQMRALILAAEKISQNGFDSSQNLDDVLEQAERTIMEVTRRNRGSDFESSQEIVTRVLKELEQLAATSGITGIQTGFADLDRMTNGFQRGDLIILAARPAMGKSALALNFANQVARRNEGAVAVFSLEMPSDSLMKRLMSSESQVFSNKLRDGKMSNEERSRIYEAGNRLSERLIFIDDTSSIKMSQIFSKCRKLKSEYGSISLIVIDYLQLISGSGTESRQQEVSEISRNLKILAKDLECPVIALSQLSRKVEERTNHEPQLSDLRESGSIEQDADIVMFLYRSSYYENKEGDQDETEVVDLSLAKHRNGAIGTVHLAFEKNISRFTNYTNAMGEDIYAG